MPFLSQRRSKNILGSFKSWSIEVLNRQIQVLRTGLRINRQPPIASFSDFLERIITTQVDDVEWSAGHFCKGNGACSCFRFCRGGSSECVIFRSLLPFGERLLH